MWVQFLQTQHTDINNISYTQQAYTTTRCTHIISVLSDTPETSSNLYSACTSLALSQRVLGSKLSDQTGHVALYIVFKLLHFACVHHCSDIRDGDTCLHNSGNTYKLYYTCITHKIHTCMWHLPRLHSLTQRRG